ncbi:MAG: HD domain-containing protein [Nanoarchaeota archaeon]|nr:HD domain-containing protein [Nanoarchaeota archaeon]
MNLETKLAKKYKKEIGILKNIFGEATEMAGGKGHRFFHQLRVAHYCEGLAHKFNLNDERRNILVLSALFHDIGKAPRIREDGTLDGSQKADEKQGSHMDRDHVLDLLNKYLCNLHNENVLNKMADIISSQESEESKILCDADILDEVGLVNVWKMFTFGGAFKVNIEETIEYYFDEDRPRLLKKSEEILHFDYSKELAKQRIQKTDDMLNALIAESQGRDIK